MSLRNPSFPKQYHNGSPLFEQNLDAWRKASEAAFAIVNKNLTQLRKDLFSGTYDYDNDGLGNLSRSLQTQISLLSGGGSPITGTTSEQFTVNSDGFALTLDSSGLSASRNFTFPDVSGSLLVGGANISFTGNNAFSGANTHAGDETFSGDEIFSGDVKFSGTSNITNIRKFYYEKDDFWRSPASTPTGPFGFITIGSGTGNGTGRTAGSPTTPGQTSWSTGTDTNGYCGFLSDPTTVTFGGGVWIFECDHAMSAISDGTNRFVTEFGFIDAISGGSTNCVSFRQKDDINSGKWQLVARTNSVETVTNTSIAVGAPNGTHKIVVAADGSSAEFFINDASVGTVTSNIPTSTYSTGIGGRIEKSAGTSNRSFFVDYVQIQYTPTVTRA